jgi:RNA polymerase sigma-70 factor (ECF subfamily)
MPETDAGNAARLKFDRLVAPWHDDLFRFAFWLSRDPELAKDVVQDSLVRAWKSIDSLRDEGSVKTWLLTIVRREHARFYERKRLETKDIDDLSLAENALIAVGHDTDIDDMRKALFNLEADYREPLVLQVMMGFSTQEIADLMGIKAGAVLTRLHRARKKLVANVRPELEALKD